MKSKYPKMFEPITISNVTFKNRVWSAPAGAHLLYGREEYPNDHVIAYYANKAKGGSAVITVSAQNMDYYKPYDGIHANEYIIHQEGHRFWKQLTDAIHFYHAKASLELLAFSYHGYDHEGKLVSYSVNGEKGTVPLNEAVMKQIAKLYADTAEAALRCGFDMILIHGGHGLILSQILSPKYNTRTDEFGGSLANRAKFPIMILDAIRERVGNQLLIEYRISGSELVEDGFTENDCIDFLEMIQDKIDIAHISAGSFFSDTEHIMHPNPFLKTGCNSYLAKAIKDSNRIHIPVLTLGGYQRPEDIEYALEHNWADLVAMARGTIADSHVVYKARTDQEENIIPCIRCMRCLDYRRELSFGCAVNPTVGRELRLKMLTDPVEYSKNVIVIGGGIAGMQAAVSAYDRGHKVTIIEKNDHLGGTLSFSRKVDFKENVRRFMDYSIRQVEKREITILYNTTATRELIRSMHPDVLMIANGAKQYMPSIQGIETTISAIDIYNDDIRNQNIVIIGGGDVGCESAIYLKKHNHITLLEMKDQLCTDLKTIPRQSVLERLNEVDIHTCAKVVEIKKDAVIYEYDHHLYEVPCDLVINASGMVSNTKEALSFIDLAEEYFIIGDAYKVGNINTATRMGYDAGIQI